MRHSQWFFGLAATATVAGAIGSGCGSSNKSGPASSDSGSDSGSVSDVATAAVDSFVCMPEPLGGLPDSGLFAPGCQACVTAMCAAQVDACNTDCTCGSTLNQVNTCVGALPPSDGGGAGGIGNIFGGGGLGAITCFMPLLSGGGGGIAGLLGGGLGGLLGGGLGGGAAPADAGAAAGGSPTTAVVTCLAMTCGCLGGALGGGAEAGTDAAPATDSGANVATVDATSADAAGQ